ncbi:MAG TPA: anthranilate synthase component I family protein [Taishania sp.]|nr:anthranilate synthase component I family protein [Taishania sp.]HNS41928.1 anthranilate synthase component I family protein [Taishania sp.]
MNNQSIAYFNSNSKGANYLCWGQKDAVVLNNPIDFQALQNFIDAHKKQFIGGFLSYDVKNSIENLTSNNFDGLHFPDCVFFVPSNVVEISANGMQFIQGDDTMENRQQAEELLSQLSTKSSNIKFNFQPRISKQQYIEHVNQLKAHIQRGDIYEINYCQEFYDANAQIDEPLNLYATINEITQAPFSAFFQWQEFSAFCGSPERFLQKNGNQLLSQPIKGTAPRGKTSEEDQQLMLELKNNPKERSENVMIVDLVRNDLSKIATQGSVKVNELFGVYTFNTVHQLISTISCQIDESCDFSTIIKATFPMGSMTGAPKVSAMKLSEEHEAFQRGLYSGTIGCILPNGNFDFNVVIRSLLYNANNKYLSCGVGGAITINSDAEKEYQECETKVRRLLNAFQ